MKIIFAEQLYKLRNQHKMSQDSLAEKMFVTRQAISTWEKGDSQPSLDTIESLAKVFDVPVENLLFGEKSNDASFISRKLDKFLAEDEADKDWHENHRWRQWQYKHIDNGWEFLARYYWVLFALIGMLAWFFRQLN